uniref:Uncharacterized protein n=1 Tax=Quercus lobata TaxID=97700 RepID=A0A7N2MTL5_QUELO
MIAFIEGGMILPMSRITRDYLINHRICPHQCAPKLFRVLGSVDALNEHLHLGLTWHDVVHMYECYSLKNIGYYLKSRSDIVKLVSCLPKFNKGMKDDYLIALGAWHDGLHYPVREGEPDKRHVAPRLSLTNVKALNYLLRSEIFVSEDGQLRAIHLILDFEPISEIYQEIGRAIKAGDQLLARIDVSHLNFLAQDDLPRVLPEVATPREEIASSRSTLDKEIDNFRFKEEETLRAQVVHLSNAKDKPDRQSGVHAPILVIAHPERSFEEEEDKMALNKRNKSLKDLMATRNKGSTSQEELEEGEVLAQKGTKQHKMTKDPKDKRSTSMDSQEEQTLAEVCLQQRTWSPRLEVERVPIPWNATVQECQRGHSQYAAEALKQPLLLPKDMDSVRKLKQQDLFMSLKRDLALVKDACNEVKNEVHLRVETEKALGAVKEENKGLLSKLVAEERERKFAQASYLFDVEETQIRLTEELSKVCRDYCDVTWAEALNVAKVLADSEWRQLGRTYYHPDIRAVSDALPSSSATVPESSEQPPTTQAALTLPEAAKEPS